MEGGVGWACFTNGARLHMGNNPGFFKGAEIEGAVASELGPETAAGLDAPRAGRTNPSAAPQPPRTLFPCEGRGLYPRSGR